VIDLEERKRLADTVLATLGQLPHETVLIMAAALLLGRGELAGVGGAFDAHLRGSPELARLRLAYELRRLVRNPGPLEHLGYVREQPWLALRAALEQLRDDELEQMLPAP
jgi:hypothetical protein